MNIELLKYMGRKVRFSKDPSHQEYTVFGINWANDHVMFFVDDRGTSAHYSELELVPEEVDEDEGWYPI